MVNDELRGRVESGFLRLVEDGHWPNLSNPTIPEQVTVHSQDAANALLDAIRCQPRAGPVWRSLRFLVDRIMRSVVNIHRLFDASAEDAAWDGAAILRTIYDAHLQALYILKEPETRGKQYVDYLWVELHQMVCVMEDNSKRLGKLTRSNLQVSGMDTVVQAEFDRVKANYPKSKGGSGLRRQWYEGTLAELAESVGYEAEYRIVSRMLNGPVHSSPYGLGAEPRLSGSDVTVLAWHFLHRVMGRIAEYAGVPVEEWIRAEVLRAAYLPVFSAELADLLTDGQEDAGE